MFWNLHIWNVYNTNFYFSSNFGVVFSLNWSCWDLLLICGNISSICYGFWDKLDWNVPFSKKLLFFFQFSYRFLQSFIFMICCRAIKNIYFTLKRGLKGPTARMIYMFKVNFYAVFHLILLKNLCLEYGNRFVVALTVSKIYCDQSGPTIKIDFLS
jgi:hypothetical protein